MKMAGDCTVHAAILDQLAHEAGGVWKRTDTAIVNAALLDCALPYVEEDGYVRPVYVVV